MSRVRGEGGGGLVIGSECKRLERKKPPALACAAVLNGVDTLVKWSLLRAVAGGIYCNKKSLKPRCENKAAGSPDVMASSMSPSAAFCRATRAHMGFSLDVRAFHPALCADRCVHLVILIIKFLTPALYAFPSPQ